MNYLTHQLLNPEELKLLNNNLNKEKLHWEDGNKWRRMKQDPRILLSVVKH